MASKYIKNSSNFDNEIDDNFDINPMFGDSKFSKLSGDIIVNNKNWNNKNVPKYKRLENKYKDYIYYGDLSSKISRHIIQTEQSIHESIKIRHRDKKDRKTYELVLDNRTKIVLYSMISTKLINGIYGCISTGKEANVYLCSNTDNTFYAIKIYKTSILKFKDRSKYIRGEFRFDRNMSKNPRKMVALWAEKEFRNLKRLNQCGIPAPTPIYVKNNVLLMSLIGSDDGIAALKLKDYVREIEMDKIYDIYINVIKYMRVMYWKCKLIHSDLSEYNILVSNDIIYIIDVSQSIEHNHPNSYSFLSMDIKNINNFFRKCGINTLTHMELFQYILKEINELKQERRNDNNINSIKNKGFTKKYKLDNRKLNMTNNKFDNNWDGIICEDELNIIKELIINRDNINNNNCNDNDIEYHLNMPHNLFQINIEYQIKSIDILDSVNRLLFKDNNNDKIIGNNTIIQMFKHNNNNNNIDTKSDTDSEYDGNCDDNDNENESIVACFPLHPTIECNEINRHHRSKMTKQELKELRKRNKKCVKAAKKQKRKNKIPKHVKKRKIKVARQKAGKTVWKK